MPILTTAERIRAVELIINYVFHDKSLLLRALEAAGATMASQGNKRLALIGDAALTLVLYELGYEDEASIRECP
jgi:ribonuclease-3